MKTDNHNPAAKLELRRHFLRAYHADAPIHVMDCCQGGGRLWHTLRDEFPVASYWGLDVKPKKGRLKLDSARVLAQPGWTQNVIDIDTYGSPWKHWLAMLPNVTAPVTVFLTVGQVSIGGSHLETTARKIMGFGSMNVPQAIAEKINRRQMEFILQEVHKNSILIKEAIEALPSRNARYIGLRLEKTNG